MNTSSLMLIANVFVLIHSIYVFYHRYRPIIKAKARYTSWYIELKTALDALSIVFFIGLIGYQIFFDMDCWEDKSYFVVALVLVTFFNIKDTKSIRKERLILFLRDKNKESN